MRFIRQLPYPVAIVLCLTLGLAPFVPEPHIWEKLKMLFSGTLTRGIDFFDLVMHATPFILLVLKLFAGNVPPQS
jgi:hypothetical protein